MNNSMTKPINESLILFAPDAAHSPAALSDFEHSGGGKALNLARLVKIGAPVPTFFCVATPAFRTFLRDNGLESLVKVDASMAREKLPALARDIEDRFVRAPLPEAVLLALRSALRVLATPENDSPFLAVRSSGLDEDSADHSFAGQFSSYLFQKGEAAIIDSLKRCWASGFSERALAYRLERGLPVHTIQVGVVIQRMVNADQAGVAFSRHPIRPLDRKTLLISSVWGVGEGLVSGELDADNFEVDRESLAITPQIVEKAVAFRRAESGGLQKQEVAPDLRSQASLSDAQVREVAQMTLKLESALGRPQDCEWVFENQQLQLVQTRPITSLPADGVFDTQVNEGNPILWDNSNIIESFCGVTTPLTFSHVSRAYRQVYLQFCELMGVPQSVVDDHEPTFRNMLGLVRGRVYYNLGSWYRMIFLFPGSASNQGFMETMMGVKQGLKPEVAALFDFAKNPPRYSLWRRVRLIGLTLIRIIRIRSIIDRFNREVGEVYEQCFRADFTKLSLQAQLEQYFWMEKQFLGRWKAPIISDTRCMVYFGLLKKLTEKWLLPNQAADTTRPDPASLQNDLLCGQGDLASTEPTRALMRIAGAVDLGDPAFRQWFLSVSPEAAWNGLTTQDRSPQIRALIQDFLNRYGFRCINELKLEEMDLHENPSFAIDAVMRYAKMKNFSIEEMEKRERAIRDRAETEINLRLRGIKRVLYGWVLTQARIAVKDREDLRFMRTKSFGVTRRLFKAMGHNLHRIGVVADPMDIFYLTTDEVVAFNEGRALMLDLRSLVAVRRREFAEYERTPPPPDRFVTQGAAGVYLRNPQILAETDLLAADLPQSDDPNVLIGTPCCPGTVEGVVRVVRKPEEAEGIQGEILVTERTDPGWVPLFPSCSGLLIERGSLLSHSAVVARELGLPTIVGISGGMLKKLKTGMRVRMDAARGVVTILAENADT